MSKIIAIKFDDGTEAEVGDIFSLKRYIDQLYTKENTRALAADTSIDWSARSEFLDQQQAIRLGKKAIKRTNASKPRNTFSRDINAKNKLLAYKQNYYYTEGTKHGWLKSACDHFLIDPKTLKKILGRPVSDAEPLKVD